MRIVKFTTHFASKCYIIGPQREKPVFGGLQKNKATDQPAHTHSLISTFVIRFLESITICKLATGEISIF